MRFLKTLLILTIVSAISLSAKVAEFDASSFININDKTSMVQSDFNRFDFKVVKADASKVFNQDNKQIRITNFPIRPDYSVTLNLIQQKSAIPKDATIKYFGKDGEVKYMPAPNNPKYFGTIEGSKNSDVFFTYSSLGLVGFIQDDSGQMYDVSSNLNELSKNIVTHSVSETTMGELIDGKLTDGCGIDETFDFDPNDVERIDNKAKNQTQKSDLIETKIAADANFEFYLKYCQLITGKERDQWLQGESWFFSMSEEEHSLARTYVLDYIDNIMSSVNRIYIREVAIIITVPYLTIFDNPEFDPYYEVFGTDLSDKLDEMDKIWNLRTNEATDRTFATVFTDVLRQPKQGTLGIASPGSGYNGVICNKINGYSALGMRSNTNFPRVSYATDIATAAHEFGHNFGCPHTHFCGWPQLTGEPIIDSCVVGSDAGDADCIPTRKPKQDGTIMSYCHIYGAVVLHFHPRMKKRIREHAEAKLTSCLSVPKYKIVSLISPLGDDKLFAGEEAIIRFQAANVPQSKLMYSLNAGKDWTDIDVVNTADDTTYTWVVPETTSNEVLVRIESTEDPQVFDQSVLIFKISQVAVRANFPKPDAKLGYLGSHNLVWERINVDKVNVKFSLDGGNEYSDIATNTSNNSIKFNFPDVASNDAVLLIESTEDPTVKEEVHFALGKENVSFSKPKMNDTLNIDFNEYIVRFDTDFIVNEFSIELQRNDLEPLALSNFSNRVDLETNTFDWTFDDEINPGDYGKLIAKIQGDDTVIGQTEGTFYFEALTDVGRQYFDGFSISNISPNPATNSFNIEIKNIQPRLVETNIYIISQDGKMLKTINNQYVVNGLSTLNVDISDIQAGTYFIMIESDKYKDVQQLKIVR